MFMLYRITSHQVCSSIEFSEANDEYRSYPENPYYGDQCSFWLVANYLGCNMLIFLVKNMFIHAGAAVRDVLVLPTEMLC